MRACKLPWAPRLFKVTSMLKLVVRNDGLQGALSLRVMGHTRVWVMRFSQPVARTVRKGNREEQKCQKATTRSVVYLGSFIQWCAAMLCDFGSHNKAVQVFKMPKMKNYNRLRCNIWKPRWLLGSGCEVVEAKNTTYLKHGVSQTWLQKPTTK